MKLKKIKVKVIYSEDFYYKGKKFDYRDIEIIKNQISGTIGQAVYDSIDSNLCSVNGEDLDYMNISIDVDIK